tara:strand:- start:20576 stop:20902 length:327 start_codon:yes stop_codon:yes gene_type:complete
MNWTTLIIGTVVLYLIYYGINIVYDLVKGKKEDKNKGYEMIDVNLENEEVPKSVIEEDYQEIEAFDSTEKKKRVNKDSEQSVAEIVGQGMNVKDFLAFARAQAATIEY